MQLKEKPAISWNLERLRVFEVESRLKRGNRVSTMVGGARISEISDLWWTGQCCKEEEKSRGGEL